MALRTLDSSSGRAAAWYCCRYLPEMTGRPEWVKWVNTGFAESVCMHLKRSVFISPGA